MDGVVLAIDTATDRVGVALGGAAGLAGLVEVGGGRRHAETLAPAIDWLCRTTGIDLSDVTAVAADVGPGLFTGMRVGLATATTLASALGVPTLPACSLDLIAMAVRHTGRRIEAILDARKGQLFHAAYVPVPGGVQRVVEPRVLSLDDLLADLAASVDERLCVGDGAVRHAEALSVVIRAELADAAVAAPSVATLVDLAGRGALAAGPLEPMYLRPPDAQINWETRRSASGVTS